MKTMKIIFVFAVLLAFASPCYPQWGKAGKALLGFFERSKHQRSKGEVIVDGVFTAGSVLEALDQREHEMRVAREGRSSININLSDGTKAKAFRDRKGKGVNYGGRDEYFTEDFERKAKETFFSGQPKLGELDPHDWEVLENGFDFNQESRWIPHVPAYPQTLQQIADEYGVSIYHIYVEPLKVNGITGRVTSENLVRAVTRGKLDQKDTKVRKQKITSRALRNTVKIPGYTVANRHARLWIKKFTFPDRINFLFACKWWRDKGRDRELQLKDFSGLRRGYFESEKFQICVRYQTEKTNTLQIIEAYDSEGNLVLQSEKESERKTNTSGIWMTPKMLPPGIYELNVVVIDRDTGKPLMDLQEKFEIVEPVWGSDN